MYPLKLRVSYLEISAHAFENHTRFYTGGSESDRSSVYAFVGDDVGKCFSLPQHAIFRCLDYVPKLRARQQFYRLIVSVTGFGVFLFV